MYRIPRRQASANTSIVVYLIIVKCFPGEFVSLFDAWSTTHQRDTKKSGNTQCVVLHLPSFFCFVCLFSIFIPISERKRKKKRNCMNQKKKKKGKREQQRRSLNLLGTSHCYLRSALCVLRGEKKSITMSFV